MTINNSAKSNVLPIIQISAFVEIYSNENLVLIDATNSETAKETFAAGHVEKAQHVDLNTQLSHIKEDVSLGGRHPLPEVSDFTKLVSQLGISPKSHVIVYDDHFGANTAARFWWMLKAIGHQRVQVLNGGIQQLTEAELPLTQKVFIPNHTKPYPVVNWQLPTANLAKISQISRSEKHEVIDVREAQRYQGIFEPIDLVAGHIPGAINIPFANNLNANGLFKPSEELQQYYQEKLKKINVENTYVYCGSGVTACHTILAFEYAGLGIPTLYTGSWSEWSRNNKSMATKES